MLRSIFAAVLSLLAGSALAVDTTFLLINSTSLPIGELSISQSQLGFWSPNLLRPPVIKVGEARQVVIPASRLDCMVDIRLSFTDGGPPAIWQYLDLCNLRKLQVFYDRYSGVTTAKYNE